MTPRDQVLAPFRGVRRWLNRPLERRIAGLTAENRAIRAELNEVRSALDEGLGTLGRTGLALRRHQLGEVGDGSDPRAEPAPAPRAPERDLTVSVVIVTYNRVESLSTVVSLLRAQDLATFEVVVVNGPSTDATAAYLTDGAADIKAVSCPLKNIAAARNLGVAAAGGDVVAFLDDDTLPEPEWVGQLTGTLRDRGLTAVGGPARGRSGKDVELFGVVGDRLGESHRIANGDPVARYASPWSDRYVVLPGGNSAYRRDAIVSAGGFDEAFAYGGEEGDLCIRLRWAGREIGDTRDPVVYHLALANEDRDADATVRSRYRYLRSKAYLARKHGLAALGREAVEASDARVIEAFRRERERAVADGRLDPASLEAFDDEVRRAVGDAEELWAAGPTSHDAPWFEEQRTQLRPFRNLPEGPAKRHVCAVELGTGLPSSIASELRAAAADGHVTRIVLAAESGDVSSTGGVWHHATTSPGDEVARIHERRPLTEIILAGDAPSDLRLPPGVPVRRIGPTVS